MREGSVNLREHGFCETLFRKKDSHFDHTSTNSYIWKLPVFSPQELKNQKTHEICSIIIFSHSKSKNIKTDFTQCSHEFIWISRELHFNFTKYSQILHVIHIKI